LQIFAINKGHLDEITEQPFGLEKDIQGLVENNIKDIFDLEFVASEFMIHDLRVDTLAFEDESRAFVIIEYKRDRNSSVADQGLSYLNLMLNNKAEFTLKYNEKFSKSLKKEYFDWTQSKVILLAPFFTTYQRKAVEFKDFPVELCEVKKYSNNTILFNKILKTETTEPITKITKSRIAKTVSEEIVTYSEDYHLRKCSVNIKNLYKELKDLILSVSPNVTLRTTKHYIAFLNKRNFVSITTRRSTLNLYLNIKRGELTDPKHLAVEIPAHIRFRKPSHYILKVSDNSDLGYILTLIRQSYDKN
jgi:predicted transport protein